MREIDALTVVLKAQKGVLDSFEGHGQDLSWTIGAGTHTMGLLFARNVNIYSRAFGHAGQFQAMEVYSTFACHSVMVRTAKGICYCTVGN